MNFREEGKIAKAKFSNINNINEFDKYIDRIVDIAYTHQAIEFTSGLLNNSSNHTLFICAIKVANKFDNSPDIWGLIISEFNRLIKGKNKPTWTNNFVHTLMSYDKFNLYNYQMDALVYLSLKYDEDYSSYWMDTIATKPWFSENEYSIKAAFLKYAPLLKASKISSLFKHFKDYYFYKELVLKSKDVTMIHEVLRKLIEYKYDVSMFFGGETVDEIMTEFKDYLLKDTRTFHLLSILISEFYSENTGKMYVGLIDENLSDSKVKINLLQKIENINSPEVNGKLFELTGEEKYLPQAAKDIFLF